MWLATLTKPFWWLVGCVALIGCEVVDLGADGKPIIPMSAEEAAAIRNMQPKDIAEKMWANIVQDGKANVITLDKLGVQGDKSYFVQFDGMVERIDGQTGAVTLVVKTPTQEVPLQIGTIVRGNAIRDATSLLRFDQFKNQVQFARLSKELNRKAVASLTKPDASWVGKTVDVLVAVTVKNGQIQDAVPLEINQK